MADLVGLVAVSCCDLACTPRVDGRFTPQFREHVSQLGVFKSRQCGAQELLQRQHNGPVFLLEPNPNEPVDDY